GGSVYITTVGSFGPPTLSSISPTTGGIGASISMTATGSGFQSGDTVNFTGPINTAFGGFVTGGTQLKITANLAGFPVGTYQGRVAHANGLKSGALPFTVTDSPTLVSLSTTTVNQGVSTPLTASGYNFKSGSSFVFSGPANVELSANYIG